MKRIAQTVGKVTPHDAELAAILSEYARRYSYTAMLSAVEYAEKESATTGQ